MSQYIPERGDIIHLNLNPTKGKEMRGERYAIVYTPSNFNRSGFVGVCPITQGIGDKFVQDDCKLYVSLQGSHCKTNGRIFCHQHRVIDLKEKDGSFIEKADEFIVEEMMSVLDAIIFDGFYDD